MTCKGLARAGSSSSWSVEVTLTGLGLKCHLQGSL